MPELRKDPLTGQWVIIGTERPRRPADFRAIHDARQGGPCMLCGGNEGETPPELLAYRPADDGAPNRPGWRVRVVPNKFPALRVEGDLDRRGHGLYD
ncbi:MAG: galactose-1-phosphate uridylyltransferase, partial [Candidatus Binatia bacterium]